MLESEATESGRTPNREARMNSTPGVRPLLERLSRPIRLGVLISGGGSNLASFLKRRSAGGLNAEFPIVIASRPDCGGLQIAKNAGIRAETVCRKSFKSPDEFSATIFSLLRDADVDLVILAGFLCLLRIPPDFANRVMNVHPALIPSFCGKGLYGAKVHEAALARGVKVSGCTVHFCDNVYDHGPIIVQQPVPVLEGDTPSTLAARVFEAECEAFPEAIRLFAEARLEVIESRVRILPESPTDF
jgi:formyltetrahydrofolate-dependent phosphoribosylglycinamide formyltransferase